MGFFLFLVCLGGAFTGSRAWAAESMATAQVLVEEESNSSVQERHKKGFLNWLSMQNPFKRRGTEEGRLTPAEAKKLSQALDERQRNSKGEKAVHYTKLTLKSLCKMTGWGLRFLHKSVIFSADVLRLILLFMWVTKGVLAPVVSVVL